MKINLRGANFVRRQKLRDLDVMPVLFPLQIVLNQNDRLLRRTTDPVKFSVGAALLDRSDPDLRFFEPRKMNAGLPEKLVLDVGVTEIAFGFTLGADNTGPEVRSGSDLCARPENCVLDGGPGADPAIGAYRVKP